MTTVDPITEAPAATVALGDGDRALLIADYHAGIEAGLRAELGLRVDSRADERRDRLLALRDRVDPDRVIVLGDLTHSIGQPRGSERSEVTGLLEAIDRPVTVVKGNHDGELEAWLAAESVEVGDGLRITEGSGIRMGSVGFAHGHSWPSPDVLAADVVCLAHEHPCVRLTDSVGGRRIEPAWLRGRLHLDGFPGADGPPTRFVLVPAFNRIVGGTWINAGDPSFLSPFLPDAIVEAEAYLLDGTRLGPYADV